MGAIMHRSRMAEIRNNGRRGCGHSGAVYGQRHGNRHGHRSGCTYGWWGGSGSGQVLRGTSRLAGTFFVGYIGGGVATMGQGVVVVVQRQGLVMVVVVDRRTGVAGGECHHMEGRHRLPARIVVAEAWQDGELMLLLLLLLDGGGRLHVNGIIVHEGQVVVARCRCRCRCNSLGSCCSARCRGDSCCRRCSCHCCRCRAGG